MQANPEDRESPHFIHTISGKKLKGTTCEIQSHQTRSSCLMQPCSRHSFQLQERPSGGQSERRFLAKRRSQLLDGDVVTDHWIGAVSGMRQALVEQARMLSRERAFPAVLPCIQTDLLC